MTMTEIISPLANRSIRTPRSGDYQVDGLWYCGVCHTPRQVAIELDGNIITPWCVCDCEAEKLATEKWKKHIEELRNTGIPAGMQRMLFTTDDGKNRELMDKCRKYVEMWDDMRKENIGLLLCGGVGTGKTYAAASIANALIDKGVRCRAISFPEMLEGASKNFGERTEAFEELSRNELLVLDDFGTGRETEYAMESLYMAVDTRYRSRLPTIITTNIPMAEIKNTTNLKLKRIYDRIMEMCVPILATGESRRRGESAKKMATVKNIFG